MKRSKSTPALTVENIDAEDSDGEEESKKGHFRNLSITNMVEQVLPKPPQKVVSIWKEFSAFAFGGGVVDLAVGIIVGGAFGKIVNSLVNDIVMPPIGWLLSGVDFANIFIILQRGRKSKLGNKQYKSLSQAKDDGAVTVNVGVFLNSVLNFVVVSVIIFTFVRTINNLKKKDPSESVLVAECPRCLSNIDQRATKCAYCTSDLTDTICEHKLSPRSDLDGHHHFMESNGRSSKHIAKNSSKMLKKNIKKQLSTLDLEAFAYK